MTPEEEGRKRAADQQKVDALFRRASRAWRPPPRLKLSEWADEYFYLSAESAAEPGRWRTLPYQRGIMDAITDRAVTQVSVMKSARVGFTQILLATIGYYIHQDPAPIGAVQPTVEDAQGFSKESIAPMLRDVPVLTGLVAEPRSKTSGNTILHKVFPGGQLQVIGANSPRGFRRVSRKVMLFDETDAFPASAGSEGDPIKLGVRRTEYYWDRKIVAGSTPVLAGASRIEELFEEGDQRRYYVPCPHCGHQDILVFWKDAERGHYMQWPEGKPEEAHFVCRRSGCVIEHRSKREMVSAGEWRPEAPFKGHASFWVWAAYSFSPNATWAQIAAEYEEAKGKGPEQEKVFVNTVLGEPWQEKGEAPDWQKLYQRRERYPVGQVPAEAVILTLGVDVQKTGLYYEVVGWGEDKQSWSIEAAFLPGDTASEDGAAWKQLDELLDRHWPRADGAHLGIRMAAVDSGYNTNVVYNWARKYPLNRVMATKGVARQSMMLGGPSKVDVTVRGKRMARGYRVWTVGVDLAKSELYGWLRLEPPKPGDPPPRGWCHFPEHGEEYFRQLTAEHLVARVNKRTGRQVYEWQVQGGRENHFLDCRILARAAAHLAGLDRHRPGRRRSAPSSPPPAASAPPTAPAADAPARAEPPAPPAPPSRSPRRPGGWLGGSGRGGSWLGRRR